MSEPGEKSPIDGWRKSISDAEKNPSWNHWDCEVKNIVTQFNQHLSGTARYVSLDWLLVKAMLWVETGAQSAEWLTRPMQIGVAGDPGLKALLSGKEGGELILPPSMQLQLTSAAVKSIPTQNIRAGIGYLLMRMAVFENVNTVAEGTAVEEVIVKSGDSLDRIARRHGSTLQTLKDLNPEAKVLHPGQKIKVQPASIKKQITGWRQMSTQSVAQRYNGGGDPLYRQKLDYALDRARHVAAAKCAQ